MVRVILTPAGEDPDQTLHAFGRGRRSRDHAGAAPADRPGDALRVGPLQFHVPAARGAQHPQRVEDVYLARWSHEAPGRNLTPVMARLDPKATLRSSTP